MNVEENKNNSGILNRKSFEEIVYTNLSDIPQELAARSKINFDKATSFFCKSLPPMFADHNGGPYGVLFRHVTTPNYEHHWFLEACEAYGLAPVFFEYFQDQFTLNNPCKYRLGKLTFYYGAGKRGGIKTEVVDIIDFDNSNHKKIHEVNTHVTGEPLVDYHHY